MLKLRSIFVTSLLTGLVITSNFGCGGSSNPNPDTNKADAKDALDVNKDMGGTGGSAVEVKPETVDASDAKDAVDTADTGDVAKDSVDVAETGDVAKDAVDATDGSEAGETLPPVCNTPICVLTNKRCGPGGGMQTCVIATSGANSGCPDWSAETACGVHQTCGGAGVCSCNTAPAGCSAAGTFCDANGAKATCAADAQGCFFVSGTAACPTDTVCTGTLPSASCTCDNKCATAGTAFCVDGKTAAMCSNDGNTPACRVISATTACGAVKNCVAGACACPATGGKHENEGCVRGTDANICDGNHILTCVRDTDSSCDIWKVAPGGLCESDNGGGLTCGKGPSGNAAAACQCPVRSGGDVFADPVAGTSDTGGVFATGIQTPAQCRLPTLTKALGVAASTAGVTRVIAISAAAAVFNTEPAFPLNVPPGVLLTTADATPTPANYTINFNSTTAANAVFLANGSTIKGLTIQNVNGSGSGTAISALPSASVTIDTVTIDAKGTGSTLAQGVSISSASATLTGVTIKNAGAAALDVNTSGTVTVNKGSLTASKTGLHVQLGAVTATDAGVTDNLVGIQLDAGTPTLHLIGGTVSGNGFGVVVAKGALVSDTGTMVQTSVNSGILISGGSASLHGIQLTTNGANGLISSGTGTTVTIDAASAINGNGTVAGDGIVSGTGSLLTISGATEISANHGNGITLLGGLTSISGVNIHNNLANGVDIRSNGSVINIGAANPATTLINNNSLNGVLVEAAPKTASDANSVTLEGVTASTNGQSGIYVAGTTGNASVTIKGSIVSSNGDTGVLVEEAGANKTTTVFQSNDVFGNKTTSNAHSVGGILFNTSSTLPTFVGNKVHSNVGDELGFNAIPDAPAVKWIISPPSAACDATANSLYCHGDGNVGLRVIGGALVDAEWVHWSNLPPAGNVDYSPFIAPPAPAQVDVSNACAVVACP